MDKINRSSGYGRHRLLTKSTRMLQLFIALLVAMAFFSSVNVQAFQGPTPPPYFDGGFGTEASPYQIATPLHLDSVRAHLDAYFILTASIDLAVAPYDTGAGWVPIGSYIEPFTGNLDGNNFTISGLYINQDTEDYKGLISVINGGTVFDINLSDVNVKGNWYVGALAGLTYVNATLDNISVTGSITGSRNRIGGITGHLQNSILKNSSAETTVSGKLNDREESIGGIVGFSYGGIIENCIANVTIAGYMYVGGVVGNATQGSQITNCSSTGSVTGTFEFIGGLTGSVADTVLISRSYSSANVSGEGDFVGGLSGASARKSIISESFATGQLSGNADHFGGLVGLNQDATVEKSYAAATINVGSGSAFHSGGLVGYNIFGGVVSDSYSLSSVSGPSSSGLVGANDDQSVIRNSFAAGEINGTNYRAGLVVVNSANEGASIDNSYWVSEMTGQATGIFSGGASQSATDRNIAEMKQDTSFSGWDFDSVWDIRNGSTYPYLRWSNHRVGGPAISGSEGWRMYGSSFESSTFGSLTDSVWTQGFTGASSASGSANIFTWDESLQSWTVPDSLGDSLGVSEGFIVYVYEDDDYETTGTQGGFPKSIVHSGFVNALPVTKNVSYTNGADASLDGFNLVSNPSASTLNWEQISGTNISDTYYVWDPANSQYDTYQTGVGGTNGGTQFIAPFQGFWVKATSAGASITIDSTAVDTTVLVAYKQPAEIVHSLLLRLENESGLSDELRLVVREDALAGSDHYDAVKLSPLAESYVSLGSVHEKQKLVIDSRPVPDQYQLEYVLELNSVNTNSAGKLFLREHTFPEDWQMLLVNTQTSVSYDLRSDSVTVTMLPDTLAYGGGPWRLKLRIASATTTGTENDVPTQVKLDQNYPNPFNPNTSIQYALPAQSLVTLEVFDMLGRKVATLINNEVTQAGYHSVQFDARNLASGIYMYRLQSGNKVLIKTMTLIK